MTTHAAAAIQWLARSIAALTALFGATTCMALYVVIRVRVLGPIKGVTGFVESCADGDYSAPPPYLGRTDEMGAMARAMEALRQAANARESDRHDHEARLKSYEDERIAQSAEVERNNNGRATIIETLGDALERLAVGDLSVRLQEQFPRGFDQLRIDFNASMEALGRVMGSILEATEAVSFGAAELSRAAERLSSQTDQQADSVRRSSRSLDQLNAEVAKTTGDAEEVLMVVSAARTSAERSTEVMNQAIDSMVRIEASSGHISQISDVIHEIAFLTNMLALNAGIEAARAGEAGRGFAVVASEVRALSQRTSNAAREISDLIANANVEVAVGVAQVTETGRALVEIVDRVGRVDALVAGIVESSRNQTASIGSINEAVTRIEDVTDNNATMVTEATNASQLLANEASGLTASISRFKAYRETVDSDETSPERETALAEIDKLFG